VWLVASACGAAAALAILIAIAASPYETTRVRNSLIADPGLPADFDWHPDAPPRGFLRERSAPPETFLQIASRIAVATPEARSAFDRALAIGRHLAGGRRAAGRTEGQTLESYRAIVDAGRGDCADYAQVFNGLALASGVPVREWGMSFDGFSGWGHAFSEVYDEGLGQWIFLDLYNSFYVVDAASGRPLSVAEWAARLSGAAPQAYELRRIDPAAFGFAADEKAVEYYRRGSDELFLWFGNNVFTYDAHPALRLLGRVSRAAAQAAAIALGVQPRMRIYPGGDVRRLVHARRLFLGSLAVAAACGLTALVQLRRWWRLRRPRRPPAALRGS
jgi:hypothetical protein